MSQALNVRLRRDWCLVGVFLDFLQFNDSFVLSVVCRALGNRVDPVATDSEPATVHSRRSSGNGASGDARARAYLGCLVPMHTCRNALSTRTIGIPG